MTDEEFARLYPDTTNDELCRLLSKSRSFVARKAKKIGLRKSTEHWSKMQRKRMLGEIRSHDTRNKIRCKATGRKMSPETIAKIVKTKRENGGFLVGPKHPNWKGGRPWERFRVPEYILWRQDVLERDNYVCRDCGKKCKKREKGLAAHHIKEYAKYPDLRFDINNGVTMCRECHMRLHCRPIKPKPVIPCACGCGIMINAVDDYGRKRRYINYHARRIRKIST